MAKRKRSKRIHPRDGRYVDGSWRSEYDLGRNVGEAARSSGLADLLPVVIATPKRDEQVDRSYTVYGVSPVILEADPDHWHLMPESAPCGRKKPRKVLSMPKVWYSDKRAVGMHVEQTQTVRHQKSYLGRGRAFHQGVAKALDGIDPELTGAQMSALIAVTRAECERRGIDWQKLVKTAADWKWVARTLNA